MELNDIKDFLQRSGYKCTERGEMNGIQLIVEKPDTLPFPAKVVVTKYLKFWKKYHKQNIYVFFNDKKGGCIYLYPHDSLLNEIANDSGTIIETPSWNDKGYYNTTHISKANRNCLEKYKI